MTLLPEEDAIDEPDDEDEPDPNLPGDLWFRHGRHWIRKEGWRAHRILAIGKNGRY
jgi:hypothetical protein